MMQARRSLAVLLSAAGASVSAGAGYLYLGEDPLHDPRSPQSTAHQQANVTTIKIQQSANSDSTLENANKSNTSGRRRPLRATTKQDLGWEQSLARDLACWISSATVYTATQVFYAAAPAANDLLRWRLTNTNEFNVSETQIPTHQKLLSYDELHIPELHHATQGDPKRRKTEGLYHALLGWMQDLDPAASSDWHADRVIQSASFSMLLNGLSSMDDALRLRRDLEAEMLRAVGLLATNPQCAAAIVQRATRYGKHALLNVAQTHDTDPRLGRALQELVASPIGETLRFGPANLLSLVALAVADDVPDEYLEFAFWALAKAASASPSAQRQSYAWRKTLFGDDAVAKTRQKLVANERLWHALTSAGPLSTRPLAVQRQAASLLRELSENMPAATAGKFQLHEGTLNALVQWVQCPDVTLACAALETIANVASNKGLRNQLCTHDALDVIRTLVQKPETKRTEPQLTIQLLRAVRSLALPTNSEPLGYALDRDALSFVDDDEDDDDDQPLHHDDLMHPSAARKHQYHDGWIELFAAFLRSDHADVRAEAALCLEQMTTCGTHQDQGLQEWLIAVLDGVLDQIPAAIAASSTSVRAAKSRTRPLVGQRSDTNAYGTSHAKALRALAFVANRPECQHEFVRRGGVPLLQLLLTSSHTEVQRETARVLANLFTCDTMDSAVAAFASHDPRLTRVLDEWTRSSDTMLRSLAHRARSNRRYQHNRLQHADKSDVQYLDNVHPLHFSTSPAFNSEGTTLSEDAMPNDNYDVDVVFLHGLLGCPYETWVCGDDDRTVWAEKWLLEDLKAEGRNPRVLSIGYDSQLFASESAWRTMCFEETSQDVLQKLQAARVGDSGRPVVFVTHSLGGVVLKQVLLESATAPPSPTSPSSLVDSVNGVIFYGVPHHGSPIAQIIQAFRPRTLGIQQHPVTDHLHGTPHLKMLNDWFHTQAIPAISIGESVPCRIPLIGVDALVVPPASANPGFGEFVCVENADHVDVCKPRSKHDVRYTLAKDFITKHVPTTHGEDEAMLTVE